MTNINIIENKISAIQKNLNILNDFKKYSESEIESDVQIRGALERYLYLAIQATIDLAEAVIAFKGLRKPFTMSEAFHILNESDFISGDLMQKMIKMTGFRNIVAHDYEKINYHIVYDILQNKLADIEEFIDIVSKI